MMGTRGAGGWWRGTECRGKRWADNGRGAHPPGGKTPSDDGGEHVVGLTAGLVAYQAAGSSPEDRRERTA